MFAETYAKYYNLLNSDKPYKKEINFVCKWAEKPKSILDIGCGTANYWKYFPSHTLIIGMEESKDMIDNSKKYKDRIICTDIMDLFSPELYRDKYPLHPRFDCATALFDVINYIPQHNWWKRIPLKKGGHFIFDVWDKKKADRDGFKVTVKRKGGVTRVITPDLHRDNKIQLLIYISDKYYEVVEQHVMYVYSEADIKRFCGKQFKIVDKRETKTWQVFYKLERL
jgi:SAM-dependent methyltransferase